MQSDSVRISIALPRELHRKLHGLAAQRGCTARQLILQSIEAAVSSSGQQRPKNRPNLDALLVRLTGEPITLTDAQIYSGIEFP